MPNSYEAGAGYKGLVRVTDEDETTKDICANSWVWDANAELLNATSFCSNGYREYISGLKDVTLTITGVWDYDFNPFSDAPTLKLGKYTKMQFFIDEGDHPGLVASADNAIVQSWNITAEVGSTVNYTAVLKGNWTFTDFGDDDA